MQEAVVETLTLIEADPDAAGKEAARPSKGPLVMPDRQLPDPVHDRSPPEEAARHRSRHPPSGRCLPAEAKASTRPLIEDAVAGGQQVVREPPCEPSE